MSSDSDIALDGRAMDAMAKERREQFLTEALQHDDGGWIKRTPWHWQRHVGGNLLNYWPTKRKWQYGGRMVYGTDRDLASFIAKRTAA